MPNIFYVKEIKTENVRTATRPHRHQINKVTTIVATYFSNGLRVLKEHECALTNLLWNSLIFLIKYRLVWFGATQIIYQL